MIPAAIVLMLFWTYARHWLISLSGNSGFQSRKMQVIGIIGALCLILYVLALGAKGDIFRLERRIGVIIYFTFTYLGQLLLTFHVGRISGIRNDLSRRIYLSLYTLNAAVLIIGVISLFLGVFYDDYDDIEDAFEWVIALLVQCYFLVLYIAWSDTQFTVSFHVQDKSENR
jgi:hypothetical protein